jgi:hypothetical protein
MLFSFPTFGLGPILLALIVSANLGLAAYLIVFQTRLFDHLINKPLVAPYIGVPNTVLALLLADASSPSPNGDHSHPALVPVHRPGLLHDQDAHRSAKVPCITEPRTPPDPMAG